MSIIHLSDEQTQELTDLIHTAPDLIIHRARLILAYAAGKPTLQAANEAGISRGRARYWKRQFIARGMGIFELEGDVSKPAGVPGKSADRASQGNLVPGFSGVGQPDSSNLEINIPYPTPMKSIGIAPEDRLADAGRKVWLFHFALMLFHEQGTLSGQDIEELHDMRVATRRMRTAFDIFGPAFEPKIMQHYLKGLRKIGRLLGEVRDMDVILEHALAYQLKIEEQKRAGLEPLMAAWKQIINKKRHKMIRHLQGEQYLTFKHEFNAFLQASEPGRMAVENIVMNPQLRDVVPVLVYARYAAVRGYETILPTASIAQLHALRIEFKKFRYVLEYFREILGENISQAINEIKRMQDHLGELHDTDVACQLVSKFLQGWEHEQLDRSIAERQNPEPVVTYLASLHAERYRLMSTYPELWRKFSRPDFRQGIAQAISQL